MRVITRAILSGMNLRVLGYKQNVHGLKGQREKYISIFLLCFLSVIYIYTSMYITDRKQEMKRER